MQIYESVMADLEGMVTTGEGGGDRVRYEIPVSGDSTFTVDARLLYQSIAYRWARNLRQRPAFETDRFVRYYDAMAGSSTGELARAVAQAR